MKIVLLFSFALFASTNAQFRSLVEQSNLNIVLSFYQAAFGQHDHSAVDLHVSPQYIEHDPLLGDGIQPLKDLIKKFNSEKTKRPIEFHHTAANGDLVWLYLKTTGAKGNSVAVVHIFRVKNFKIVEHWDLVQVIPPLSECKNSHPMF